MSDRNVIDNLNCPLPLTPDEFVVLGHGSGGRLSADLIQRVFLPALGNEILNAQEDQATLCLERDFGVGVGAGAGRGYRLAFSTDGYVVNPLFFPGGSIGDLAVNGTVNDLAMGGAIPRFLSAAFILEEGLSFAILRRVVANMRDACLTAGVTLVTADTKVVGRGHCDQMFITTSGIGMVPPGRTFSIHQARPGDQILVSGTIGDHGMAVMSIREGLEFETVLESDTVALNGLTQVMLDACPAIRCMRDPTRGGLASTLNELAAASKVGVKLNEASIRVKTEVRAACEMLGLDPLYVANEGKLIVVVPAQDSAHLLNVMRGHPLGRDAAIIGEVVDQHSGMVVLRTCIGGERLVTMLSGEQLPRIC